MKSLIKLTFVLLLSGILFSSCHTAGDDGKMIPKNALIVLQLNTKSLLSKLSWDDIKQTSWFKELHNDSAKAEWTKKIMDNPENSGIDFKSNVIIFFQKTSSDDGQIVLEGSIKDAKAFEEFNKNLDPAASSSKDGDLTMLTLKNHGLVGWNDKNFVYITNSPTGIHNGNPFQMPSGVAPAMPSVENLPGICKSLFALKKDSSLNDDKKFTSLLKEDGDIHLYQNTEQIVKSSAPLGALSMLKLDVFLQGNIVTTTVNFENGKIDAKQKLYAGKELTDLLQKYGGGKIDADMIKSIPSQDVVGLFSLHFKPEGIKEIIKLTGMDGMLNMITAQQGISLDDFIKANKGDILVAATDFKMKKDSFNFNGTQGADSNFSYDKPDINYLFAVSIGDKPSFDKLLNAGKKLGGDMEESKIAYANNDKLFVIGNTQQVVSKYLAGSNNSFPFLDKLSDHPIAGFVDIHKILAGSAMQKMNDSAGKILMDESLKMWDNIYFMGGEYKDDGFAMQSEVNFIDKNTNSLKQLNKYFDNISAIMMEKKKAYKNNWDNADESIDSLSHMDTVNMSPSH